jgi:hypothetical protein
MYGMVPVGCGWLVKRTETTTLRVESPRPPASLERGEAWPVYRTETRLATLRN